MLGKNAYYGTLVQFSLILPSFNFLTKIFICNICMKRDPSEIQYPKFENSRHGLTETVSRHVPFLKCLTHDKKFAFVGEDYHIRSENQS